MISLYPYQEKAKGEIRTHFKNGRKRVLLQMPTGAGNVLVNPKLDDTINSVDSLSIQDYHFVSSLMLKDNQTSGYLGYRRKDKSLDNVYRVLDQLMEKKA
jgi:hypothetical protein